jgi:hypothetical protein
MTSATTRVARETPCEATRIPASNTNSTSMGMAVTSAESARLPATGS